MSDSREKFSSTTVVLHWLIGLTMLGMVAFGFYLVSIKCAADDKTCKASLSGLIGVHKSIGLLVLAFATWRLLRRMAIGLPPHAGVLAAWENVLAKATQIVLLLATLAMPLSGIAYSAASGYPVALFGIPVIPKLMERDKELADLTLEVHETFAWTLLAVVVLHVAGALKRSLVDGDGTIKRMLGARIEPMDNNIA
jgi:cytochrome b561